MKTKKILSAILAGVMIITSVSLFAGCKKNDSYKSESSESVEITTEAPKELTLPVSNDEALKMSKDELYQKFTDAGFKNAERKGLQDLSSSSDKLNGVIKGVTVDGKEAFKKGDKAMSNIPIIISYHSVKEISLPFDISMKMHDEDGFSEFNYEDLITQFKKEGFTNISTRTFEDESATENTVKEISVDGKNLKDTYESIFPIDAKVVITYYTKKAEESKAESKEESKVESSDSDSKSEGSENITPSFKETMDSYEEFFDEYVEFMKKYKDNPSDITLISDYSEFLKKYTETMSKLNSIDKSKLSAADLKYYTDSMARITKKLEEITQ